MKKLWIAGFLALAQTAFAQEAPKVLKTGFSKVALSEKITTENGKQMPISEVLAKHRGRVVLIDFWASWCRDCINAMPEAENLHARNPKVDFVYFSLDRKEDAWKAGIIKHNLQGRENYWFSQGWKNPFNNEMDLNWIPRYMVVDQKGKIAKYYAIVPQDPDIQEVIDKISKK